MLTMQVRSLAEIASEQASKAERLAIQALIQWVVIAALVVWIIYLLEAAR
jgi:hypothetical protein